MQGADTVLISLLEAARLERTTAAASLEDEVTLLFGQLRTPLLRYLFTLGLPAQDAEEVAQEVFLALFRHLQDGKPRTNLKAWVFRAGHNLGLRARNRIQRSVTLDEESEIQCDPAPNPEDRAAQSQRQRRLMSVLRAMQPQDRACIHLRAEGLKYRDIAGVLGISLGSVAQAMERAVQKLRRMEEC
jgi:RNA polymerase sigma-70 factor (ECF subfamily)